MLTVSPVVYFILYDAEKFPSQKIFQRKHRLLKKLRNASVSETSFPES